MRRSIDDKTKAEAVRQVKAGIQRVKVARALNISQPSLNVICRKAGIPPIREQRKAELPSDKVIMSLHAKGLNNTEIAAKCRCSDSYVSRVVTANHREEKPSYQRPPAKYDNFQREEYIDQLLKS